MTPAVPTRLLAHAPHARSAAAARATLPAAAPISPMAAILAAERAALRQTRSACHTRRWSTW